MSRRFYPALFAVALMAALICGLTLWANATDGVLTWTGNTEPDLAGYKIYRANQGCTLPGPLAFVASVGKVVTYTDPALPPLDGTMCWEITAFDTSGNESGRSNRVSKVLNTLPPQAPTGLGVVIQ